MLDRSSLRTLAQHPEQNDPLLNVALAEEGDATVLLALADCVSVGPEALSRIADRIATEGERVGHEPLPELDSPHFRGARRAEDPEDNVTHGSDLDARLVVHPRSDDAVRDAILARHEGDAFFLLAAAAHRHATSEALERLVRWPSKTALHDRPWLALIDPSAVPPLVVEAWARDDDPLAREAAARICRDPARLEELAADGCRRVRRAVASNPSAGAIRGGLATGDPACEVRARASSLLEAKKDLGEIGGARGVDVGSARFKSAVESMKKGGSVASDVVRAVKVGPLDPEGARLAASALDESIVAAMVSELPLGDEIGLALAAGIAFRGDVVQHQGADGELVMASVRALAGADRSAGAVTGKGRFAAWLSEGVAHAAASAPDDFIRALQEPSLAADRMVLARVVQRASARAPSWVNEVAARLEPRDAHVPIAFVEIAWREPSVADGTLERLLSRVRPAPRLDAAPENDADLDPRARPLELLERVGSALVGRAQLSPRAALALVALEPRRVRYVLSAMPQWKGTLTGVNVAKVLRAHAGALSAAGPSVRRTSQAPAGWTQRRLDEVELAIALAIGDLGPKDVAARLASGQDTLLEGTALAAGMEARAALDGAVLLEPLVEYLAGGRTRDAAALASWLLVEGLDRPRSPSAIAAALDAPWAVAVRSPARSGAAPASARSMVGAGISEALATLERRRPGRLAESLPQTPRGRAALVSGIARAYRALGGMSVNEG